MPYSDFPGILATYQNMQYFLRSSSFTGEEREAQRLKTCPRSQLVSVGAGFEPRELGSRFHALNPDIRLPLKRRISFKHLAVVVIFICLLYTILQAGGKFIEQVELPSSRWLLAVSKCYKE